MPQKLQNLKSIEEAYDILLGASAKEKEELFRYFINRMEGLRGELQKEEKIFSPHEENAYRAFDELILFVRKLTGYNPGWIEDEYAKHCVSKGRPVTYTRDNLETKCIFIGLLSKRGSSKTQAMKLIMRVTGDVAMSEGQLKILRSAYKEFEKSDVFSGREKEDFLNVAFALPKLLEFSASENLVSEERASHNLRACHCIR